MRQRRETEKGGERTFGAPNRFDVNGGIAVPRASPSPRAIPVHTDLVRPSTHVPSERTTERNSNRETTERKGEATGGKEGGEKKNEAKVELRNNQSERDNEEKGATKREAEYSGQKKRSEEGEERGRTLQFPQTD